MNLKRQICTQATNNVPEPPAGESECDVPMRLTVAQCIKFCQLAAEAGYAEGCKSVHAINDNKWYLTQHEAVNMIMYGRMRLAPPVKPCKMCGGKGYAGVIDCIACPACTPKKKKGKKKR